MHLCRFQLSVCGFYQMNMLVNGFVPTSSGVELRNVSIDWCYSQSNTKNSTKTMCNTSVFWHDANGWCATVSSMLSYTCWFFHAFFFSLRSGNRVSTLFARNKTLARCALDEHAMKWTDVDFNGTFPIVFFVHTSLSPSIFRIDCHEHQRTEEAKGKNKLE